ncbi:methyl-accepting chemotaxis protein [Paenibacillus sp. J23TS9]|uniref:methyl-accepting chemotaxis protein n=1 Tax=Paenibacillus sp. J23TS9 TaxID=2807193 RepID=UPI001FD08F91|nr:methyl-accepting chemotaxis protein [Paenibacillus sp. J23TS9]
MRNLSLKYKISLLLIPVIIVVFMLILQLNINTLKSGLSRDLEHELEGVGNLTAMQLDPVQITSLVEQAGKDNPDFEKVQNQLDFIQKVQGTMASSYVWRIQDGQIYPVVFTSDLNEVMTEFNKPLDGLAAANVNAAQKAYDSGTRQITGMYEDALGSWRTIMQPIRSEGKVVAVLGIDYSAAYINNVVSESRTKQIIITLVGIAVTGLIIYFVIYRLLLPLRNIVGIANKIADGDLTTQDFSSDSNDEIGQLYNAISKMNSHLRSLIHSIQEQSRLMISSSEQVQTGAMETENYSLSVTKDISEVASQTTTTSKIADETVIVLEETALGIQRIAESTSSASEESNQMADDAESGHHALQEMMNQMEAINISVGKISDVLHNLNLRITEIGTFTELITEVSHQTNLLSLNASIEAARAGEHGAGFAVVASEIRKLAESTNKSAAGISDLVSRIQESTNDSMEAADHGQQEATRGLSLASEAGQSFSRILQSTSNVAMQMQEISASLEQISASSEEATASVTELKYAAGNIARTSGQVSDAAGMQLELIQEISKSTQSLSSVSRQLQEMIMVFKV